jgi:iron complex transport system ATP-binding protein
MELNCENISIGHNLALVNNINLSLQPGTCVALMGVNGSGKSTLLRTLCGLQNPISGTVKVNNIRLSEIPYNQRHHLFSMVKPLAEFPGLCTVYEFVLSGLLATMNWTGLHDNDDHIKANEALKLTGITHLRNCFMSSLSDGEKQKAYIARALIANTAVVLFDEPVSFLDIPAKREIMKLIQSLAANDKIVIYSSHDMECSVNYSTHIWLIKKNKLITGRTVEMTRPVHEWFNQ